jgi:K+:H+ antiporter
MTWATTVGIAAVSVAILLCGVDCAFAAETPSAGPSDSIFLLQIIILVLLGRFLGELMQRIRQPAVMGQLLAGLLLGPSFLGAIWPAGQHAIFPASHDQKSMIDGI